MLDVRACLARCCQSENRKDQPEGTGNYGEHHYTVVGKKHGFHHWPPLLCPARPELWSIAEFLCDSFSRQTQNSGTAYVFLPTQPKINAATEFKVVDKFFGRTAGGNQMRDVREVRFTSESGHVRRN